MNETKVFVALRFLVVHMTKFVYGECAYTAATLSVSSIDDRFPFHLSELCTNMTGDPASVFKRPFELRP